MIVPIKHGAEGSLLSIFDVEFAINQRAVLRKGLRVSLSSSNLGQHGVYLISVFHLERFCTSFGIEYVAIKQKSNASRVLAYACTKSKHELRVAVTDREYSTFIQQTPPSSSIPAF